MLKEDKEQDIASNAEALAPHGLFETPSVPDEIYQHKEEEILKGIDFDKLTRLMNISLQEIQPARSRDLILLVGKTGAGKSTTLNYLMGCPLQSRKRGARTLIDVENGPAYAEIGHDILSSKTLYPKVVPTKEFPELAYIDLPGFRDTRISEEKLCSHMGIQMAIRFAKAVRGIIVVIDFSSLIAERGTDFVDLLNILGGFLKNETVLNTTGSSSRLLFVFSKVPLDCTIEDILTTIKDANTELLSKQQTYNEELNKIMLHLAEITNFLAEWRRVNQNIEARLRVEKRILETAFDPSFIEAKKIKDIHDRYKMLSEEWQKTVVQLVGFELILKYKANPVNLFIIRGKEPDDKRKILEHIAGLQNVPPIKQEDFILDGNKDEEWNVLDKVIQRIAREGAELLRVQTSHPEEYASLKKYKKLVQEQHAQQEQLLQHLKSHTLSALELNKAYEEIFSLSEEMIKYLNKKKEEKQHKKKELKEKLSALDTAEPTRYEHPSLAPVIFEVHKPSSFGFDVKSVVLCGATSMISIPFILAGGLFGLIGGGSAKLLQQAGLNISDNKIIKISFTPLLAAMFPSMKLLILLSSESYDFQYNDLPFINIQRKCDPFSEYSEMLLGNSDWFISNIYNELGSYGFDVSREFIDPIQGKYEINYRNRNISKDYSGKLTVWIELFVEKRIHPEFKPRIDILKNELARLELVMSSYIEPDLKQVARMLEEEKKLLIDVSKKEVLQSTLCEILEKRLLPYQKRMEVLCGCLLGYQADLKKSSRELFRQRPRYNMLTQLTEMIPANQFVKTFLSDCNAYFTEINTHHLDHLNIVWGRKHVPDYQVESAKISGHAIGAFFKAPDKPKSIWLGKLGYKSLLPAEPPTLMAFSRVRRGSALESVLEKIAADFYEYLSDGSYLIPKTRLAELPIKNKFTERHALTGLLFEEINQGRDLKINEGVYVMSKCVKNYQNLADLKNCFIGEELLSFEQCLERGQLPEKVAIENKKLPLKGLMELLAVSRLLMDTDVLGGDAKNAGFVIERNVNGEPSAVRVVKVDPGFAFNFRGSENLFYQSFNTQLTSQNNLLKQDKRHLQYGNIAPPILWCNLTEIQQNQFILALESSLEMLENNEKVEKIISRKAFDQTPSQRKLPDLREYLQDFQSNVVSQKEAYAKELTALKESSQKNYGSRL